ncbi:hypothetical protein RHMOL_Rhmol06G0277500 [Rhododendron molle]|nr:hypothetical protein RHMOL_Rhmol06G0277500 [Rhododendron molle]
MDIPIDASWTIRKVLGLGRVGQPSIQLRLAMVKVPSCGLTIDTLLALYSTDLERVLSLTLADHYIQRCILLFIMGTRNGQGRGIGSLKLSCLRLPLISSQFVERRTRLFGSFT